MANVLGLMIIVICINSMTKKIVIDYSEYQNIQKEINSLKEELYFEQALKPFGIK